MNAGDPRRKGAKVLVSSFGANPTSPLEDCLAFGILVGARQPAYFSARFGEIKEAEVPQHGQSKLDDVAEGGLVVQRRRQHLAGLREHVQPAPLERERLVLLCV